MPHKLTVIVATRLSLHAAAAAAARLPPPPPANPAAAPHPVERRSLISGGSDAPENRYPYMCALGRASKSADTVEKKLQVRRLTKRLVWRMGVSPHPSSNLQRKP